MGQTFQSRKGHRRLWSLASLAVPGATFSPQQPTGMERSSEFPFLLDRKSDSYSQGIPGRLPSLGALPHTKRRHYIVSLAPDPPKLGSEGLYGRPLLLLPRA